MVMGHACVGSRGTAVAAKTFPKSDMELVGEELRAVFRFLAWKPPMLYFFGTPEPLT